MRRLQSLEQAIAIVTVGAKQYEDHDDCLAAAAREYAEDHGLGAWEVTAAWAGGEDGERDEIVLTVPCDEQRTEDQWWAWHDADASRWSAGEGNAATTDAESRCAAWAAGESDDGPAEVTP